MIICQIAPLVKPPCCFFVGQKWQDVLLTPTKRAARTICATPRKWSASWLSISRSREDDHAADARRKVLDKKKTTAATTTRPPPVPLPSRFFPPFPSSPHTPYYSIPLLSPYPTLSSMCSCGGSSGLLFIIYIYILVLYSSLYYTV